MKKVCLISVLLFDCVITMAQQIPAELIEDSVLGWMNVYHYKGINKPLKVDAKLYSAEQLSICDSFANWIQASYLPKGGLGDVKKFVSEKLGLYNQDEAALPQAYGAYAKTYYELKYNSNHKMVPLTNSHVQWSIMANGITGYPVQVLCTPDHYYFTLPSFAEQGYEENLPLLYGLAAHPNTKKFFTYFKRNSKIGNEKTVILFKDNKSPFIQITKGEYLEQMAAAIERKYKKDKEDVINSWPEGKARNEALAYAATNYQVKINRFNSSREKYKNRLQEKATVCTLSPSVAYFSENEDVFEGNGGSNLALAVYKIDPATAELCKKDKPQWIKITWHGEINTPVGKHQHESIINHFNFDYVYNFFFDPEKVKGQPYRPLHSIYSKEITDVKEASPETISNTADKTVHRKIVDQQHKITKK